MPELSSSIPEPRAARASGQSWMLSMLPTIAAGSVLYFIGDLAVQHVLRPSYDPVRAFVSAFVVGRYGSLQVAAFAALGIGLICLAIGLRKTLTASIWLRGGATLLVVCGVSTLSAATFTTDLPGAVATAGGIVHATAAIVGYCTLVGAMWALSVHFLTDPRWTGLAGWSILLAVLGLILLVMLLFTLDTVIAGLTQRLFGLSTFVWLLLVSLRLALGGSARATTSCAGRAARSTGAAARP